MRSVSACRPAGKGVFGHHGASRAPHGSPAFVLEHGLHPLGGLRSEKALHEPERDVQAGGDTAAGDLP